MKKIYLMLCGLSLVLGVNAQAPYNLSKNKIMVRTHSQISTPVRANTSEQEVSVNRSTPIWEDDFSTPSDWTVTNGPTHTAGATNPGWEIVTSLSSGLAGLGFPEPIFTNGGNFALIDSDGAGPSGVQDSEIEYTAGPIDLSIHTDEQISLEFENYHKNFQETVYVYVSTDGGTTWTEYEVNQQYGADVNNYTQALVPSSSNPELVRVNLGNQFTPVGLAGLNNVSVKFRYVGAYDWFWCVDNVAFVPTPPDEGILQVARFGAATPDPLGSHLQYYQIPLSQLDPSGYLVYGEAKNDGFNTQTNGRIDGVFTSGGGSGTANPVASAHTLASWTPGDTLFDTTAAYIFPAAADSYEIEVTMSYDNSAMNDLDPTNNSENLGVTTVNSDIWGRTAENFTNGSSNDVDGANNGRPFIFGTEYFTTANETLEALRVAFHPSTDVDAIVYPYIVQIDPFAADFQDFFQTVVYDGSTIANSEYIIQAGDISSGSTPTWVQINLQAPVTLNAGQMYMLGFGYYGGPERCLIAEDDNSPSPDVTNFFFDADGSNPASQGNPTWYWTASSLLIQGVFNVGLSVEESEELGITLGQNIPNPANNTTAIEYTIEQGGDVTLDIVDVTGKTVMTVNEGNRAAGTYRMTLDTDELSGGVYFYTLTANGKRMTKRMVIEK